jgi:cardiolipin synthase A/B
MRRRARSRRSVRTLDAARAAGGVRSFPFATTGSYPARSGNRLLPLIDGAPAFRRLCEAIDAARRSVWSVVTFMWASFEMPDGRGSALQVLSAAAARGLDVRLIFWRPDAETEDLNRNAFSGSREHLERLEVQGRGIKVRWDRAAPGFCQHQKCWLIDACADTPVAFLGGINLNPHSMVAPGHAGEGENHDVYVELAGPSVVDVHHNFVQRWNEASERRSSDGRWGAGSETGLEFPSEAPAPCGQARAQVQRTMPVGRYVDGRATPGGVAYDVAAGERSTLEQYCAAIGAARRSIYLEHQHIDVPEIIDALRRALARGVEIAALLPAAAPVPCALQGLTELGNFTLAGIAGAGLDGRRCPVWVHAKLMLVDDEWATVGSCNLHRFSLFGNSELNVSFLDPAAVRALRVALFAEHLGRDTSWFEDRAALRLFRQIAADNRRKWDGESGEWQGLAFSLSPAL